MSRESNPHERSEVRRANGAGIAGVPASERVGGSAGAKPPGVREDWAQLVREQARRTSVDLPPGAITELAAHLEDLYNAARQSSASHDDAMARARQALEESALATITAQPHRRFRDPALVSPPPFVGRSPFRSLSMGHALRLALRQLVQQRSFAAVTLLVLALGIGASVAVYSVVDALLLRPLPYSAPDRLVKLWDINHEKGLMHETLSPVTFMDYRRLPVFADAAAWWRPDVNLTDPGLDPVRVKAIETSANLFQVLGVKPQHGPGFPDNGPFYSPDLQAVISDRLWRTRYNADPSIIGRQLTLSGGQYTVVGIMPPRFDFPGDIDVWERLRWDLTQHSRHAHFMEAVARLAPGVEIAGADVALKTLTTRLGTEFPPSNKAWGVRPVALLDDLLGYYRAALIVLIGAVGLLLTIACLNVASLLLTRAISRDREIAVRSALGATPRHLVVQLIAEGAVLSILGTIAGIVVAAVALPLLLALGPAGLPRLGEVSLNPRVLAAAAGIAVTTTMFFGLVPAILLRRKALTAGLRSSERGSSRQSALIYRVLVVGEVALAAALLASSALLVRTVARMADTPTGVSNESAFIASVQLSGPTFTQWPVVAEQHAAILANIRQRPGVRAAGASNFLPFDQAWDAAFAIEGAPPVRVEDLPQSQITSVTDGYFEAMGAALVSGRLLGDRDGADAPGVVVVNETFVKRYLSDAPPVGRRLVVHAAGIGPLGRRITPDGRVEVVGVVADVRNMALGQPIEPAIYLSARQFPFRSMFVVVDASTPAAGMAAIQGALKDLAPAIAAAEPGTWGERVRARTAEPRLLMTLLVTFAALAALLAALGVYGLFSWSVALRQRELAIRLTLGARPAGVGARLIQQAALLVVVGLGGGWLLVTVAEHALSRVLFEVSPNDPGSLVAAASLLLVASLIAVIAPAWRAMTVDPVEGLRAE